MKTLYIYYQTHISFSNSRINEENLGYRKIGEGRPGPQGPLDAHLKTFDIFKILYIFHVVVVGKLEWILSRADNKGNSFYVWTMILFH